MAVQRYISSSFWSDDWVDSLNFKEKLLYMYLLTNECTSISGVYKITIKRIKDDTGVSREEVQSILDKFAKAKKAYYFNEHIVLPTWLKHQHLNNQKVNLGVRRALKALPAEIIDFLRKENHFYYNIDDFIDNSKDEQKPDKTYPKVTPNDMSDTEKPSKSDERYPNKQLLSDDSDLDFDSDLDRSTNSGILTNQEINKGRENKTATADKPPASATPTPCAKNTKTNKKRFIKPSLQEIKEYCLERNNNIDAEAFYDFYESVGWKIGGKPMKNWQAAVRTWERRKKEQQQPLQSSKNDYTKQNFSQESTDGYFQDRGLENTPLKKIDTDKILEDMIF